MILVREYDDVRPILPTENVSSQVLQYDMPQGRI